ncbi:hypothetical protein C8Q79DRAFT_643574 [Trametes meyenii]|nr:hypothetical protein C8Q79DRAFT_643574 [Trametes meyenii]
MSLVSVSDVTALAIGSGLSGAPSAASLSSEVSTPSTTVDPDPVTETRIPPNLLSKFARERLLDLVVGNYRTWSNSIIDVLSVCGGLDDYLCPEYKCPNPVIRGASAKAWLQNNRHVFSYLRLQCSDDEREHLGDLTLASELWEFLRNRHDPRAQVLLLRDLLKTEFDTSLPLVPQLHKCITLCRQVITMGNLSVDSLAQVMVFHMMRNSSPDLQRHIADALSRATTSAPYTIADVVQSLMFWVGLGGTEYFESTKCVTRCLSACSSLGMLSEEMSLL